jgi:hypothetical protein
MNNLLLLAALGAGYVYFTKPKTTTKKTTTTPKTEPKIEPIPKDAVLSVGSKEVGYAIYDCNLLIIYDAQKAYNYAAKLGAGLTENNGQFDDLLFGKCFENAKDLIGIKTLLNTKEKAVFAFNLLKNIISGYASIYLDEKAGLLETLYEIKTKLVEVLGFDSDNFDVSLVNVGPFPLDKGFTITNCQTFKITDPVKMKAFSEGAFQSAYNSSEYKDNDINAPFDFAVDVLKLFSPECYAKITSKNFSKDNFVIAVMIIASGFVEYIGRKYIVKDGKVDPEYWKEFFATKEEYDMYMLSANKVLQDWIQPLLIKFGFTEESLKALVDEIQKVGKYPVK